jgi:hypothetical protein
VGSLGRGMRCGCAQAHLRDALGIELGMGYMEPERLWQPVRHCLAYVLLRAGQAQAAAEVRASGAAPMELSTHCSCPAPWPPTSCLSACPNC